MTDQNSYSWRQLKIVPDFFDLAEDLRAVFEGRFVDPRALSPERFLWDYWHVPAQFTYFRTYADKYFPNSLYGKFLQRLRLWGQEQLGCGTFSPIWLSYYVEGCTQELHVDPSHGPWSFVYSLTRWETRRFAGGETMLLRPSDCSNWNARGGFSRAASGSSLQTIPAHFNQLIVFDPRIPHGVTRLEGTRDPREARLVLHGWFKEPTLRCGGDLSLIQCQRRLDGSLPTLRDSLERFDDLQGLVVVRVEIDPEGTVKGVQVLADTLMPTEDPSRNQAVVDAICGFLQGIRFPEVTNGAWVTVPIRFPVSAPGFAGR